MDISYVNRLHQEKYGFDVSEAWHPTNYAALNGGFDVKKHALKTGTTICGVVCKDGVCLATDTRATMGPIVFDKDCQKLHELVPNIWVAGAGGAADLDHTTVQLAADLKLFALQTKRMTRVQTCVARLAQQLFKYQGHIRCALVIGGVDATGCHLSMITPDGFTCSYPFLSMGSGGLFASSILEASYRDGMSVEEGVELVADAIQAGIMNDLGSGSNVDVVIIRADAALSPQLIRTFRRPVQHLFNPPRPIRFPLGTTTIISETRRAIATGDDVRMQDE